VPIFKAEAAAQVGRMDERLWYVADWDLWLKLASLGPAIHHPVPLVSCRIHRGSQTLTHARFAADVQQQYATVLARHLTAWEQDEPKGRRIARVARFAADLNVSLMAYAGGRKINWFRLLYGLLRLGPLGWYIFYRDSQIVARSLSRIRAGIVRVQP